ncbi:MAG: family 10 glycosylhydrolase [Lentisphaerae bacterium]|nr:family 10 glycosylhydrolase [Lentisphaerota bacterium]
MRRLQTIVLYCVMFAACQAWTANVVLVRGTTSIPNKAEQIYAKSVTDRLHRWLTELGIEHDILNDDDVVGGKLTAARIVILGYNPRPDRREMGALAAFVKRGGKIIVFYSAEPALAKLMHMKLGEYMACREGGRWSEIRFNRFAPAYAPDIVMQESLNIRPVYPAQNDAKVIASWYGNMGEEEPAWVQSVHGAWMTHILLDDGDTENKKLMILALLGAYDSSVWRSAAARCMNAAGTLSNRFPDFRTALSDIVGAAHGTIDEIMVAGHLGRAHDSYKALTDHLAGGKYPDAVIGSRDLKNALTHAYIRTYGCAGLSVSARDALKTEFRGIWNHSGEGLYSGDWDKTCRVLASHGITDLFVNVLWAGIAHYESDVLPRSDAYRIKGDLLAQCIKAAHRHGIRVHAWKVCWFLGDAPKELVGRLKREGRFQVSDSGESVNWLCPSGLDNVIMEKESIREVVRKYNVDGIHLDYIRYPNSHYCYCPVCKAEFQKHIGKTLKNWPASVQTGELKKKYSEWRLSRITRLMRDVHSLVKKINPNIKVSAAVYGKYPICMDSVAQDWGNWLQQGIVDFVCPMNYTTDLDRFEEFLNTQLAMPKAAGRIYPGIGVTAAESRLNALQVIDQIGIARRMRTDGFVLFDLNRAVADEILPVLSLSCD